MILKSLLVLFLGKNDVQGRANLTDAKPLMILGKYHLGATENFDEYLYELGVSYILRNLAKLAKPTITISRTCEDATVEYPAESKDCDWRIYTETPFKTHTIRFKLEEQVDDYTMDGRTTISIFNIQDENTLIEHQLGDVNTTLIREFDTQKMKVTLLVNDVTATSIFPRLEPYKQDKSVATK
jgi:hypothetical protein